MKYASFRVENQTLYYEGVPIPDDIDNVFDYLEDNLDDLSQYIKEDYSSIYEDRISEVELEDGETGEIEEVYKD